MVFLVVLFLIKDTSVFQKSVNSALNKQENGLTASSATIEDSVNKDTDGDGIPDWQEGLYGLDPTKKETTPGIPDSTALNKMRGNSATTSEGIASAGTENLTQTEKFSRELFATVAATSQNGTMDQATIDALSASLAEKIQNPVVRKVFLTSDIKIINDDSKKAIENYFKEMNTAQAKYPLKESVTSILQKFIADGNNVDSSVLVKLDPAINQMQGTINEILKINVPQSLLLLHLDLLNAGERLMENISDMKLFDSDPIVTLGAMSKNTENLNSFQSALVALMDTISKKLNN